jgi:hypothetical protein
MNHIDDAAELYAIGALDDLERMRVDAHVATCGACAGRLGEAERAVTLAIEADPQYEPSSALRARLSRSLDAAPRRSFRATPRTAWFALAAAIAIAVVPAGFLTREYAAMHATVATDDMLMQRLADGSLASATFAPMKTAKPAPSARVMYARSGDFYAVVVRHPTRALEVAYVHPDGTMETIGKVERRGSLGVAVMPIDHKMLVLALVDGTGVVAEANLAFN